VRKGGLEFEAYPSPIFGACTFLRSPSLESDNAATPYAAGSRGTVHETLDAQFAQEDTAFHRVIVNMYINGGATHMYGLSACKYLSTLSLSLSCLERHAVADGQLQPHRPPRNLPRAEIVPLVDPDLVGPPHRVSV